MITTTISTTSAFSIVGVAAGPSVVGDSARDREGGVAAIVTSTARLLVRFCAVGGTALGFKLTPCDVFFADFDTGSGSQFVCFAHGARDTRIKEDALY